MTIGTNVLLLPMHHPLRVAEDAAVVDFISGGRFVLGVGQGYVQHEFETLGFERKYRPSLFEEGVEVIRRASEREGRVQRQALELRRPAVRTSTREETANLHRRLCGPRHRPRRTPR